MNVNVTMLNVGDGDAIIIELIKSDNKILVMVIDGGKSSYYERKLKPALKKVLTKHNKSAPDIVVCTHYDSDHIGGLIPLIKDYISEIGEVWIHKTPKLLENYESEIPSDKNATLIIESLTQLKELIKLIPTLKLKEVFHNQKPLSDWQEISILGPTKEYYDLLFPSTQTFEKFILEETCDPLPNTNNKLELRMLEMAEEKPCDRLKTDKDTTLTSTNKASIIIAIDNDKKRYLFTGDAGIDSFKAIPNWKVELKDLYFLKIPHHASDNNISKELIKLMKPQYAYNTGDKYQDENVIKCLKNDSNCEVKTTKEDGDLFFNK